VTGKYKVPNNQPTANGPKRKHILILAWPGLFCWEVFLLLEVICASNSRTLQLCLNQRHRGILLGDATPQPCQAACRLGPISRSINLDGPIDTTHEGEGAVKTSSDMEIL